LTPEVRLYLLQGRRTWYADTRAPDGKRWQFSTGQRDEASARAAAEERVRRAFGDSAAAPVPEPPAGAAAAPSPSPPPPPAEAIRDRIRRAGGADHETNGEDRPSSSSDPPSSPPPEPPTEEAVILADVISLAAVVGWTAAVDRRIRKSRWKDGKHEGHFQSGPANQSCIELMQKGLRNKTLELIGRWELNDWMRIAGGGAGIAATMWWQAERVEDAGAAAEKNGEAPRERRAPPAAARTAAPAPPAPPRDDDDDTEHGTNLLRLRPER
jgi:hypothetical protein